MTNPAQPKSIRLCLPLDVWPQADQAIWRRALVRGSPFDDEGGELADTRQASRIKYAKGWGRWLAFLRDHDADALGLAPAARCAKPRIQAYVEHLRQRGNANSTIVNRLEELGAVVQVMQPGFDSAFIKRVVSLVRSKARPTRSKAHVRPTDDLVGLGLRLMAEATDASSMDHAIAFRDGLLIAFLALHPIRRVNLAALTLDVSLFRQSAGFFISFCGEQMKNHAPFEAQLAEVLVEPMIRYLATWRPLLITGFGRWTSPVGGVLWVSADGSPMTQEGLSGRIELRTQRAFGKAMSPHRFRDAAATTLVTADPARVRSAAPLLGHRSLSVTEKHYIQARGFEAQRSYLKVLEELSHGNP